MLFKKIHLILLVSFLIRFVFLFLNPNYYNTHYEEKLPFESVYFKNFQVHDSQEYKELAINILKNHRFSWNKEPATFRTPFYPLFISLIFFIFGIKDFWVMFFQVLISTISIYIIYLIGKNYYDERVGLISSLLFTFDPLSIFYSSLYMSETLFIFLLLISLYFFSRGNYMLSSIFLSFCALTKPVALYLFIIFTPFIKKFKKMIIFLLLFSILPFLWCVRNYINYKVFKFTSIDGFNLLYYNTSMFESFKNGLSLQEVRENFSKQMPLYENNPLILSSYAQKIAINNILEEPVSYLFFHFKISLRIIFSTKFDDIFMKLKGNKKATFELYDVLKSNENKFFKAIIIIFCIFEISLASFVIFFSIIYSIIKRKSFEMLSLFLIFYFFLLSGTLMDARFRFPIITISYILFPSFLIYILKKK